MAQNLVSVKQSTFKGTPQKTASFAKNWLNLDLNWLAKTTNNFQKKVLILLSQSFHKCILNQKGKLGNWNVILSFFVRIVQSEISKIAYANQISVSTLLHTFLSVKSESNRKDDQKHKSKILIWIFNGSYFIKVNEN